jgi:hypothetical protein
MTQAEPAWKPSASQSVSVRQAWQLSAYSKPALEAQKPALPVVVRQIAPGSGRLQRDAVTSSVTQRLSWGVQRPTLCPTQAEVSGCPCLGATPSQMPEQQSVLSPRHGCPTSRQPN